MDLIDIDEALQDDSFCVLKEDMQEDIDDILQQWKQKSTQPQGAKCDTRTFTRPKRKLAPELNATFDLSAQKHDRLTNSQSSGINLQIGGLVTSMQRSFLGDVSPPSSICSSMDISNEHNNFNNSLITSGDFTNVSFFKTNSDDNFISDAQFNGYNLDDVIKDRMFLENLTMSGDSTTIKDSNIAQIDEISYPTSSNTNSRNSTMCNSTDSNAGYALNETFKPLSLADQTVLDISQPIIKNLVRCDDINGLNRDHDGELIDDPIANTTFSLVDSLKDSSIQMQSIDAGTGGGNSTYLNVTVDIVPSNTTMDIEDVDLKEKMSTFLKNTKENELNRTFPRCPPTSIDTNGVIRRALVNKQLDETIDCVQDRTYDLKENNLINQNETFNMNSPAIDGNAMLNRTGTPKNSESGFPQSTPHRKSFMKEPPNISPIVCVNNLKSEKTQPAENPNFPDDDADLDDFVGAELDMKSFEVNGDDREMLFDGDENDLDEILDDYRLSAITAESNKMRQSLDYIKKRHSLVNYEKQRLDNTNSNKQNRSDLSSTMDSNRIHADLPQTTMEKSSGSSTLSMSGSGERLLNRRSRLYDNIQINFTENGSSKLNVTNEDNNKLNKTVSSGTNSRSTDLHVDSNLVEQKSTEHQTNEIHQIALEKTELGGGEAVNGDGNGADGDGTSSGRVRDRDRDRFKTIRIFRKSKDSAFNVPCVDNDDDLPFDVNNIQPAIPPTIDDTRFSRKDNNSPTAFLRNTNNNNSKLKNENTNLISKNSGIGLKRPTIAAVDDKRKPLNGMADGRGMMGGGGGAGNANRQRSLSRPKYASALAQHGVGVGYSDSALPKASSAGSLEMASNSKLAKKAGQFGFGSKLANSKPSSQPSLLQSRNGQASDSEKLDARTFKMPQPVSNLRVPNSRRTGLVRPSSGFYSYNITKNDSDTESGRYSPSDSLSSASSKGSTQELQKKQSVDRLSDDNIVYETNKVFNENQKNIGPQKATTAGTNGPTAVKTGIQKPSGLRPPSNMRKSGLPRPSSIVRR